MTNCNYLLATSHIVPSASYRDAIHSACVWSKDEFVVVVSNMVVQDKYEPYKNHNGWQIAPLEESLVVDGEDRPLFIIVNNRYARVLIKMAPLVYLRLFSYDLDRSYMVDFFSPVIRDGVQSPHEIDLVALNKIRRPWSVFVDLDKMTNAISLVFANEADAMAYRLTQ